MNSNSAVPLHSEPNFNMHVYISVQLTVAMMYFIMYHVIISYIKSLKCNTQLSWGFTQDIYGKTPTFNTMLLQYFDLCDHPLNHLCQKRPEKSFNINFVVHLLIYF